MSIYNNGRFQYIPEINDLDEIRKIENHITTNIGMPDSINHEVVSDVVHVDLYVILAEGTRNYHTIITSGMSALPSSVPEGEEEWKYTELIMYLPESWPISDEKMNDSSNYWPVGWLKILANYPHKYKTYFGFGDTIPNGSDPEPFDDSTEFCCMLLLPPIREKREFLNLKINDKKTIRFLTMVPIYKEEMEYKLKHGAEELLAKFKEHKINDIINVNRINTCK